MGIKLDEGWRRDGAGMASLMEAVLACHLDHSNWGAPTKSHGQRLEWNNMVPEGDVDEAESGKQHGNTYSIKMRGRNRFLLTSFWGTLGAGDGPRVRAEAAPPEAQ